MMDNDPTIKLPPRRQTGSTDDTTIKLPPHMRGSLKPRESPQGAPLESSVVPEKPARTYEQKWRRPVPPKPAGPLSSSSVPPVVTPPRVKKTRKRWLPRSRIALTLLAFLLVVGGCSTAFGIYYFETTIQNPLTNFIHPVSRGSDEPNNNAIPSDSNVTGQAWNILLLGSDNDGKYSFPALLTQVMMVVHIDTANNTVTLVSIPRDSWVNVPEVGGMHKIDQAFFLGVIQHNKFDDGVRLARLTIERDYGITIDRYAWVGLDGFARVIDTLGGLDIDITHPIVDDSYPDDTGAHVNDPYAYKRLYIAPGPQHLNGQQALEYVRSRHADLVGDIGRTQRQQQVLTALRQRLNLGSVLSHLQQLIADMQGKVYTDLSEQEMLGFASFGRTLPGNAITRITLGPGSGSKNYGAYATVYDPTAGSNQDVILPICENIQPLLNNVFGPSFLQSCNVNG